MRITMGTRRHMAIIHFENYVWKYTQTKVPALKGINLEIEEGTFVGIIGPNGATVEDEVVFGMENIGLSVNEIRERLDWVVPLTKIGPLMDKPPYEVSGGQKARVALASVLAMMPGILVLDEPTSMLDPISRKQVFEVLAQLKQEQHSTIIVIEHSLENLVPLADCMVLLYEGEVALMDDTEPFFEQMDFLLKRDVFPPGVIHFFYELLKSGYYRDRLPLTLDEAVVRLHTLMESRRK
jgi:energy-coupling factor transporter ATP-binding protein EcfA2